MSTTRRMNAGNGHWYKLDGEKVDGVTTVISNGMPKPALVGWAANTIANNVIERITVKGDEVDASELVAYLREVGHDNRRNRWPNDGSFSRLAALETLSSLHWKDRDQAANKGTAVHGFAERLALGEEVTPPEHLAGHVDAYLSWWDAWQPTDLIVEPVVGNRRRKYMGSLDIIAVINGERWLIDIKTNRSGPFPEVAIQLAAYGNAEFLLMPDGSEHPMPKIDRYGVLWLRADGHDFYPVNVDEHHFRLWLYAQQVARFQASDRSEHIGPALTPDTETEAA